MTSFHEMFLRQTFQGLNVFSVAGTFLTLGIMASCICRLDASRPSRFVTSGQLIHLYMFFWATEAFVDLLFFQLFSGHDIAYGLLSLLYLHTTRDEWRGKDCVIDFLNRWNKEHRRRLQEMQRGVKYGRRATDREGP